MIDINEREGADITASDMVMNQEPSEIVEFYKDSTIFLTGGTGFLGRLFIEKLLRTCKDVKHIYLLLRAKKGKDIQKRFEEIFDVPCFEPLRRQYPKFTEKISIVNGDLTVPGLGLTQDDVKILTDEVNCVIHCAATVRFDEELRIAVNINVRAVKDLIQLAKQMKQLRVLTCISTAFSNCIHNTIGEKFYDPPMTASQLIALVDCLDDEKLNKITPTLLGEYPNTYVFTKAVAESVIREEGKNLPIALFRPSIVTATSKEPITGWIDNIYGATGVLLGVALGVLRILHGIKENRADMVPADFVINCGLAIGWDVAKMKSLNDNKEIQELKSREEKFEKEIPVFNYVSSPEKPITWDVFEKHCQKHALQVPSTHCVWHYLLIFTANKYFYNVLTLLLHTIPAYIVDFFLICLGKKPMLVKGYQKINKFGTVLSYFTLRQWTFNNNNVQTLWKRLNKTDQELFEFSMKQLNWDRYFYTYIRGIRVYLVKDPLDTIPEGRVKYYKLLVAHYLLLSIICGCAFMFTYKFFNLIVNILF